jgi:GNAT superfamily N-acetyltransferase
MLRYVPEPMPRLHLVAPTQLLAARSGPGWRTRPLVHGDSREVSALLVRAYLGTSEATDEDDQEVDLFFAGAWGSPILAGTVAVVDGGGTIVAASLVCDHEARPLLAHVVSCPTVRGTGAGAAAIAAAANGLHRAGFSELDLAVASDNLTALRLYARLGFALFSESATMTATGLIYGGDAAFDDVREQFARCVPELDLPGCFGVGVRHSDGSVQCDSLSVGPDDELPGRVLALIAGHRVGEADVDMDGRALDALISLWAPAAVAARDNRHLSSWRGLRKMSDPDATFVARFRLPPGQ